MSCDEIKIKITALIDGELSAEEQVRLRKHLEKCPTCAAEKAAQASLRKIVRKNYVPPQPPKDRWAGFNRNILDRVAPTTLTRVSRLRVRWAAPLALAASLAIVFGVLYFAIFSVKPNPSGADKPLVAIVSPDAANATPVKLVNATPQMTEAKFCEVSAPLYLKPGYETSDLPTENGGMVIILDKSAEKKSPENKH